MQRLTFVALFNALSFLPWDTLLAVRLVSRGCRNMVTHETQSADRTARSEKMKHVDEWAQWEEIFFQVGGRAAGFARRLLMHICDIIHPDHPGALPRRERRRPSALELPGMPMQDPLDELQVEWGNVFPSDCGCAATNLPSGHPPQSHKLLTVEWLKRCMWRFQAEDGSHGRWYLGAAESSDTEHRGEHYVISFGLLTFSNTGSVFSIALSFLFSGDVCCDLYWHFCANPGDVSILQRRPPLAHGASVVNPAAGLNGNESLVSSHPQLFGHWFTSVALDTFESKVPLAGLIPFSLLVTSPVESSTRGLDQSLSHLLSLCSVAMTDHSGTQMAAHVENNFLRPISNVVASYVGKVFTMREEFAEMVTPKGVWTYPTGMAFVQVVDTQRMWTQRSDRLLQNIKRSVKKGLGDMFLNGWVPIGLLVSFAPPPVQ